MPQNDTKLLKRWNARRDAEAFNELVTAHASQVYATCLRILRNEKDAEDVAQECFLRLAQSTGEIKTSIGGWLHRVATTKSLDRIRSQVRQRTRERNYQETRPMTQSTDWNDIQEHIDAAIDALPDDLRLVLVSHFMGQKSHAEVARELGLNRRTVSYRIQRGLENVRQYLSSRGITLSATALASLFTANVAQAAPITLNVSLGKLAITLGTGPSGSTATTVSTMGVLMMKGKTLSVCIVMAALIIGGVLWMNQPDAPSIDPQKAIQDINTANTNEEDKHSPPIAEKVMVKVADTQEPPVPTSLEEDTEDAIDWDAIFKKEGYTRIDDAEEYASIAGIVMDQDGYPIEGAQVSLMPSARHENAATSRQLYTKSKSNKDGSFRLDNIAFSGRFWLNASKSGFADTFQGKASNTPIDIKPGNTLSGINIELKAGTTLKGRVLSAQGDPVDDAIIQVLGVSSNNSTSLGKRLSSQSDSAGYFSIGFDEWSHASFRVRSEKYGTGSFPGIEIQDENEIELRLLEPAELYGTIKDKNGKPIANGVASFIGEANSTQNTGKLHIGAFYHAPLDKQGKYSILVDAGVTYRAEVKSSNWQQLNKREDIPDIQSGERREWSPVIEAGTIVVRGVAIGEPGGKPYGLKGGGITVYANRNGENMGMSRAHVHPDNGTFEIMIIDGPGTYTFRARHFFFNDKSSGPSSKPYELKEGDEIDIQVTVPEAQWFSVRAVDAEGNPLEGASVSFITDDYGTFHPWKLTNSEGRLDEPIGVAPYVGARMVVELAGYAPAMGTNRVDAEPGTVHPEETIVLVPGAGFEADLTLENGDPLSDTPITIQIQNNEGQEWVLNAQTNADGHMTIINTAPAEVVSVTLTAGDNKQYHLDTIAQEIGAITNLGTLIMKE